MMKAFSVPLRARRMLYPIGVLLLSKKVQYMKRTILFLLLSSLMLLCALFVDTENGIVRALAYIGGLLFWIFLLLGYIMFYRFSKFRKEQQKNNRSVNQNRKPGIIVFFSNPAAKKADIAMILTLIIWVPLFIVEETNGLNNVLQVISVLSAAAFIFAAQMHAILNGVNYRYYLSLTETTISDQSTRNRAERKRSEKAVSEGDNEPMRSDEEQA